MPGRRSTVLKPPKRQEQQRPRQRKPPRRGLDALAIAEDQYPSKPGVAQHRFGDDDDEGPSKRKRDSERPQDDDGASKRRRTDGGESDYTSDENRGEDSEGNEWQTGKVDSEDDSDIDSDEALGSSDEEKFEGFTFRGSSRPKSTTGNKVSKSAQDRGDTGFSEESGDQHEDNSEDEPDDDLGEDAVDLATALDVNAEDSEEEAPKKKPQDKHTGGSHQSESEDDDQSADEESDLSISEDEDDNKKGRGLSKLQKFVDSLESEQAESSKPGPKSHSVLPSGELSEYGVAPSRKLTVADLMPTVTDSRLKGSLKHIDPNKSKSGKLDAPLAKRQQDRIDRSAAYEKSKETLNRWIDTVKANRRAEHLSFPLPEPNAPQESRIVDSKPRTDLESTIQNILVESGLAESNGKSGEDRIQQFEELEVNKLPLEEIQGRRAELRKARDLMFREEMRAKRIKKIKSKSYRRVHRKEREREEDKEREALAAAGVDIEDEDSELNHRRRAEARMGAKHKDSKWAKSLQQTGRTAWDEEARTEMAELARREDELRKRMKGKKVRAEEEEYLSSSSEDSADESDGFEGDGSGPDAETRKLKRKVAQLENNGDDNEVAAGPHANLLSMKFMQNAEAARKAANDAEIKGLNKDLAGSESPSEAEDGERGRQSYGKQKSQSTGQKRRPPQRQEFEEPESDENTQTVAEPGDSADIRPTDFKTQKPNRGTKPHDATNLQIHREVEEPSDVNENPWLSEQVKGPRKKKDSSNGAADITLADTSAPRNSSQKQKPFRQNVTQQQQTKSTDTDDDDDKDSENDARGPVVLQNEDLVKKAFAGDEVVADFSKEKHDIVKDEGDKVVEETLPGWGSWAGTGLSKHDKKQGKRDYKTVEGVKPHKRKDAKLDRVIINEKRVKKVCFVLRKNAPTPLSISIANHVFTEQQISRLPTAAPV